MFMMPIFVTVMNIYAMCNLHDISWGNRPAAADSAQLSIHAKKQAAMLDNYKMFRVNAFCLWALFNILFIVMVESIMKNNNALALNDGQLGTIELFSVVMAIMAAFRITFGTLHVLRMKCELSSKKFRIQRQNLKAVVNTMQGNLDESDYLLKDYLAQEERDQADDDLMATYSPLDLKIKKEMAIKAQKEQMKKRKKGPAVSAIMDADNDDVEFSDAEAEEIQDVEEHEQAADLDGSQFMNSFMASRKQAGFGAGRGSYVEKVLERSRAGADLKR